MRGTQPEHKMSPEQAIAGIRGGADKMAEWYPKSSYLFKACVDTLEEQLKVLREFFDAFEEVESGIVNFDLHNEAVMRMGAAREAVYAIISNPTAPNGQDAEMKNHE